MKRIVLALTILLGTIASASATCTSPATMHDFPGGTFLMSLATNAGDGNCASNVGVIGTLPPYASIPAFKIDQTTPGTTNGVQVNAALPAGTNLLGKVGIDQTTPGTTNAVVANAGTNLNTSALALSANQTNGTQQSKITDGTNVAAVKPASTAPVAADPAVVVALSPNGNQVFSQAPTLTTGSVVKGITAAMTGTTSTQVIAAVTSQHIYVLAVHCNNSSTTATLVNLQDGSGGTTLDTIICPAGGGDERNGGGGPLFWTTAGNALFAADVTTGASVIVQASGYSSAN